MFSVVGGDGSVPFPPWVGAQVSTPSSKVAFWVLLVWIWQSGVVKNGQGLKKGMLGSPLRAPQALQVVLGFTSTCLPT